MFDDEILGVVGGGGFRVGLEVKPLLTRGLLHRDGLTRGILHWDGLTRGLLHRDGLTHGRARQLRDRFEQAERNFLVVLYNGFFTDPVENGHKRK